MNLINELLHFESTWIKSVQNVLRYINATIELKDSQNPLLQREGDICLMDSVIKSEKFLSIDTGRIVLCCLYLGVVTLSDITKSSGNWINIEAVNGHTTYRPSVPQTYLFDRKNQVQKHGVNKNRHSSYSLQKMVNFMIHLKDE